MKVDDRIEEIERELGRAESSTLVTRFSQTCQAKGILKGLQVSDAQLEAAKRSLFKHV